MLQPYADIRTSAKLVLVLGILALSTLVVLGVGFMSLEQVRSATEQLNEQDLEAKLGTRLLLCARQVCSAQPPGG